MPFAIPSRGMNARDALSLMAPVYGISLVNVLCEQYGLRTRKGYKEWTSTLGGTGDSGPVGSILVYYPAIGGTPKVFATRSVNLYDVTAGGTPGAPLLTTLSSLYVTSIMFHNTAGAFLLACADNGGYFYYNGTAWTVPTFGAGTGQIGNIDPAKLCFVMEWKKKVWFVEKDSTHAWYLATSAITGPATMFDFGEHFSRGGKLVALANWTVDGGQGVDDYLIAVSSQGDVVIYQGTDPNSASTFKQQGRWSIGALPAGRRSVYASGGDVYILSQQGVIPVSKLLAAGKDVEVRAKISLSYLVDPIVADQMQRTSQLAGWQIVLLAKEELVVVGMPDGRYLAMKTTTDGWSILKDLPYSCFGTYDATIYAGSRDGRVLSGFDGQFDDFKLGVRSGEPVRCEVTPAYQSPSRGKSMTVLMMRPTFLSQVDPTIRFAMLFDYGIPTNVIVPSLPTRVPDAWGVGLWNSAIWSGSQKPIKRWYGAAGQGIATTPQVVYSCLGDTVLTSIDLWAAPGGVL